MAPLPCPLLFWSVQSFAFTHSTHAGNSKSAQQAVATAVIYLISQGKGDQAASLVGDAEQSLRATGDTSIADATTSSYGAAIQQTFTDTTLTVSADDVGGAVAGALLQGQGLAIATVTALGTVSTTNCPEVNTVVAAAKTTAVANGKETAFISALGNLEQIARTDSNSPAASLFSCVPNATATDVQKASKP